MLSNWITHQQRKRSLLSGELHSSLISDFLEISASLNPLKGTLFVVVWNGEFIDLTYLQIPFHLLPLIHLTLKTLHVANLVNAK